MTTAASNSVIQKFVSAATIVGVIATTALISACAGPDMPLIGRSPTYPSPPQAFAGPSNQLTGTVLVPTLDTPAPQGKNVIWCASFQLAWDHLRQDVVKQPVRILGAEETAERLNAGTIDAKDLPPGCCYAVAGNSGPALKQTIQQEMGKRFPNRKIETEIPDGSGVLAFAYLEAAARFTKPYFDRKAGIDFKDAAGKVSRVSGFGLFETKSSVDVNEKLAAQIQVLYRAKGEKDPMVAAEFALDLDRHSQPCQIIVAKIAPKATLAATLADLNQKIAKQGKEEVEFSDDDQLGIPNLNWEIDHHFAELEGKLLNTDAGDLPVLGAQQIVEFRLDKSGAVVASESSMFAGAAKPQRYILDGPFLIVMQKRGAHSPFFAMWVGNAELLCK